MADNDFIVQSSRVNDQQASVTSEACYLNRLYN